MPATADPNVKFSVVITDFLEEAARKVRDRGRFQ